MQVDEPNFMITPEMYGPSRQHVLGSPPFPPFVTMVWRYLAFVPVSDDDNFISLSTLKEGGHPFHSCGYHYFFREAHWLPNTSLNSQNETICILDSFLLLPKESITIGTSPFHHACYFSPSPSLIPLFYASLPCLPLLLLCFVYGRDTTNA